MTDSTFEPLSPARLAAELLNACIAAGEFATPPHLVQPVVNLLTRLTADRHAFDDYSRLLAAESAAAEQRRPGTLKLLANGDSGDIPDVEIARYGFGCLSPRQLADYALSPNAIRAIGQHLACDPELEPHLGRWYFAAVERAQAERPEYSDLSDRLAPFYATLAQSAGASGHRSPPGQPGLDGLASVASPVVLPTPLRLYDRLVELGQLPRLTDQAASAWSDLYADVLSGILTGAVRPVDLTDRYALSSEETALVLSALERVGLIEPADDQYVVPADDQEVFRQLLRDRLHCEVQAAIKCVTRTPAELDRLRALNDELRVLAHSPISETPAGLVGCRVVDCLLHIELLVGAEERDGIIRVLRSFSRMNMGETGKFRKEVPIEHDAILAAQVANNRSGIRSAYVMHFGMASREFAGPLGLIRRGGTAPESMWRTIAEAFEGLERGLSLYRSFNVLPPEFTPQGWERLKTGIVAAVCGGADLSYLLPSSEVVARWVARLGSSSWEYEHFPERVEEGFRWFVARLAAELDRPVDHIRRQVSLIRFHSVEARYADPYESYRLFSPENGMRKFACRPEYAEVVGGPESTVYSDVDVAAISFLAAMRDELPSLAQDDRTPNDDRGLIRRVLKRLGPPADEAEDGPVIEAH